jgi:subtilisin-like proprotein convertase family protein
MGPLYVRAGAMTIRDIVVGLEIVHTYAGDLSLTLHYDNDNDGSPDASSAIDLHLARIGDRDAEELYAIPIELGGTYFFKDEGWQAAGEDISFAKTFDGQPNGGSFYLTVVDHAEGHKGLVASWTVEVQEAADPMSVDRIASF